MERVDMYRGVHKGVRRMLSQLVELASSTAFGDVVEVRALERAMNETFDLLESHAHHEDEYVMPLVARAAPEVMAKLASEHHEHDARFADLRRRIGVAGDAGHASVEEGHAIVVSLSRLVAELWAHMADEEELAQPALWRAYDDAELARVHDALVGSIPPPTLMTFLAYMVPAMSAPERAGFLGQMRASAPPEAFEATLGVLRGVMPPTAMARLERDLRATVPDAA